MLLMTYASLGSQGWQGHPSELQNYLCFYSCFFHWLLLPLLGCVHNILFKVWQPVIWIQGASLGAHILGIWKTCAVFTMGILCSVPMTINAGSHEPLQGAWLLIHLPCSLLSGQPDSGSTTASFSPNSFRQHFLNQDKAFEVSEWRRQHWLCYSNQKFKLKACMLIAKTAAI